jgi:hypothetical protein
MRTRAFGLTVIAVVTVACGQTRSQSPSAPSSLSQPANIAGNSAVIGTLSAHETGTFEYRLGLAGSKATAENGDVVTVTVTRDGTNKFDVAAKSATGGGTFVHKTSGGTVVGSGTWVATGLLDFQSYGNGVPQGFPASNFGGRAALTLSLTPSANPSVHLPAILQMECLVGEPPAGATEGIRLNVKDVINFNTTVPSGVPPFIKQ